MKHIYPSGLVIDLENVNSQQLQPYGVLLDGIPAILPPFGKFNQWKVASRKDTKVFRYISKEGFLIPVEEDMLTDLASIPKLLRIFFGADKKETVGAVYHDKGYRNNHIKIYNVLSKQWVLLTRAQWDMILHDLMALAKTRNVRRWFIYRGVRIGGWYSWYKRSGEGRAKKIKVQEDLLPDSDD